MITNNILTYDVNSQQNFKTLKCEANNKDEIK
ncbi:hypothetical protein M452_0202950 [Staphylococcus epidermidis APO35]|nr:hypothetical protein M462_0207725 [Staphylococcus epidermidis CIM28]ESR27615.1 hypothetical protein M452_0202950 [Staphylococcus epidermidis APO35]ESU02991.1 hypothetical protein M461_0211135 [Staphylococcus epidermidis CIM37]ESV09430.1 hypothetical protein M456_0209700 [Staphylococcus epidermidis MC28]ESV14668.1 hypothetical protein M463_0206495 [Staphylococcus epidermidis WI05]ESV20097.1 hypothetical protein M464_0209600 [Staphylococcus epidermidis WI09]ESV24389.1 hypothetical protein M4